MPLESFGFPFCNGIVLALQNHGKPTGNCTYTQTDADTHTHHQAVLSGLLLRFSWQEAVTSRQLWYFFPRERYQADTADYFEAGLKMLLCLVFNWLMTMSVLMGILYVLFSNVLTSTSGSLYKVIPYFGIIHYHCLG